MKMLTLQQQKEIIEAAIAGKEIELRGENEREWAIKPLLGESTRFDFLNFTYRVKRAPRVLYYNEMPDGRLIGRFESADEADAHNALANPKKYGDENDRPGAKRVRRVKFVEDLSDDQP